MQKEANDTGVYGTLTGIIYCPKSNHYIYMINGDPVAIYDDKLIVNTSKCSPISNENDELRSDVLKELITILLDSTLTVQENIKKLKK